MTRTQIKPAQPLKTSGLICPSYASAKTSPFFFGAKMVALTANNKTAGATAAKRIKNITNNLRFHNQITVKISLYHGIAAYREAVGFSGRIPDVKGFAVHMIDGALQREVDREIAIMARGENVASNQRRRRVLGQYLLSKPYRVIKNFYGASMQSLSTVIPAETGRESGIFHSDIIHERTDKTVYTTEQTQIERPVSLPAHRAAISDGDLNRIAAQAARQVEKKMRYQRERIGKW